MKKVEQVKVNWTDVSEFNKNELWLLYIHHTRMTQFFLEKFMGMDKPKRGPKPGVKRGPRKGTKYGPRKAKRTSKAAAE